MTAAPYVVCLGEALIDFLNVGRNPSGMPVFEQNPGGAPANVARNLARLGTRVAFVGAVGVDPFGEFLRDVLTADGVDAAALVAVVDVPTTLAFIHLDQNGDRTFSFVRSPGADTCLRAEDVPHDLVAGAAVLHAGSLSLTHPASSRALHHAMDIAAASGVMVSFDVNLRPLLWEDLARAHGEIISVLQRCHLAKLSQDELHFVLPDAAHMSVLEGARVMMQAFPNIRLLAVTMGAEGSLIVAQNPSGSLWEIRVPGLSVTAVDTTGAGDTYCAALLHRVLEAGGLDDIVMSESGLCAAANFSGSLASDSVTTRGAVTIHRR